MAEAIRESSVEANGMTFALLESGPADGPLALLLHGFPDTAWTWRHLLPELGGAGFRAVAPFNRGYAPTSIPSDATYALGAIVTDVTALHAALGGDERAVVVGHDWGAAMAYGAAALAPERLCRVVGIAVPPAIAFFQGLTRFEQLKRSWYMFFFQTGLAESVVASDDLAFIDGLWADWSPGYDAAEDLAYVKRSIGAPENLSAALGYYRAMFDPGELTPEIAAAQGAAVSPVPQPTLYLHGTEDGCLGIDVIGEGVLDFLGAGSSYVLVEGAGHFAQLEQPELVNRHILEWLTP